MRIKFAFQAAALAATLTAVPASAIVLPPAFANIDWSTFGISVIDTDLNDGIEKSFSWVINDSDNRFTDVYAQEHVYVYDSAAGWTGNLAVSDGVAQATASTDLTEALFAGIPSTLNSYANSSRRGDFIAGANTLVTFQVAASVGIDLPVPLNGQAYAWSRLEVRGPGFFGDTENNQNSGSDKLVFANGLGSGQYQGGTLYASFFNGTNEDMQGSLNAFSTVNSNGFIPVVPEPETYGMMLAGLGLLVAVARRRRPS